MKGGDANNIVEAEKRPSMEQDKGSQDNVEGEKERGPRMERRGEKRRPRMKKT